MKTADQSGLRLAALDLLRGLVIVLMTLDHVRDFFAPTSFNPLDYQQPAWFFTRWITHLCAPAFVLLAGISAFLRGRKCSRGELSRYLLSRGLLLILLELTWINFSWQFGFEVIVFQVIWALGAGMVLLALLVYLPLPVIAILAAALILPHNLLDAWHSQDAPLWLKIWHQNGGYKVGDLQLFFLYPLMPWLGLMAAGYAAGPLFLQAAPNRVRVLAWSGLALLLSFVLLRAGNWYGDPRPWQEQGQTLATLLAFLDVQKYPPSLLYLCVTLGLGLLLLACFERWPPNTARQPFSALLLFGRHPLFYYSVHVFLIHALGWIWMELRYGGQMERGIGPPGYTPSLLVCYLAWLGALLLMYGIVRTWQVQAAKRRRN